jgi:hypothetical protein
MKEIGIAMLAHGEEHIGECISLLKSIKEKIKFEFEFYIATNNIEKFKEFDVNILVINEDFNYNLKRIPIGESMKNHEITIFIDSDTIVINDIDFENIFDFEDGLHALIFKDYPKVYPYYGEVQKSSGVDDITYIFEFFFIIKLKDFNKREEFIKNWNRIYYETIPTHIYSKNQRGSQVGLVIGSSCETSGIKIIDPIGSDRLRFFHSFEHLFN